MLRPACQERLLPWGSYPLEACASRSLPKSRTHEIQYTASGGASGGAVAAGSSAKAGCTLACKRKWAQLSCRSSNDSLRGSITKLLLCFL
jgi:hypothetical protein